MSENNQLVKMQGDGFDRINFFNPDHLKSIQRAAKMFANSELVPDMYKVSEKNTEEKAIANCVIAMDIANQIGANVLMVMQNMVPIYGKPSWSSKFLVATVNTCGRFEPLRFKFTEKEVIENYKYTEYESEWKVGNTGKKYKETKEVEKVFAGPIPNIECIAFTNVKGDNEILESSPVSVRLAIDEGWYTKKGSKWPNMTKQMLMYRAASFWTSVYAPELSMGMRTIEENQDIIDVTYEEVPHEQKVQEEINKNANKEELDIEKEQQKQPSQPAQTQPKEQQEDQPEFA